MVCLSLKWEKGRDSAGPSAGGSIGQWPWVMNSQRKKPTPCVPLAHPTLPGMTVSTPSDEETYGDAPMSRMAWVP